MASRCHLNDAVPSIAWADPDYVDATTSNDNVVAPTKCDVGEGFFTEIRCRRKFHHELKNFTVRGNGSALIILLQNVRQ